MAAYYLPQNAGDIARKYIKDPQLLSYIDVECFLVSTVNALQTLMINASMVLCDRHFEGINYPIGGVGCIKKHGCYYVGTPKTHWRYLARVDGTYGPMPRKTPKGLLGMPFNTTGVNGLYCVGDSCFPGQGVIAVAFSGVMCAHRVAADIGLEKKSSVMDTMLLRLLGWLRTLA
nr:prolycopene isomerase 1, chloroplastic [Arachis hypogaea]